MIGEAAPSLARDDHLIDIVAVGIGGRLMVGRGGEGSARRSPRR